MAGEHGLLGKSVFFVDDWIPYAERHQWLQEADLGLTLHADTPEAEFAARARYMDYLWAGLPCILARGDEVSAEFGRAGAAVLVEPGEADAVTRAVIQLLDDGEALDQAREAAAVLADRYRWATIARDLNGMIEQVESSPRAPTPGPVRGLMRRARITGCAPPPAADFWLQLAPIPAGRARTRRGGTFLRQMDSITPHNPNNGHNSSNGHSSNGHPSNGHHSSNGHHDDVREILDRDNGLAPAVANPGQRILVAGGAGYIGSILVPRLLKRGYRVRVLDRLYFGEDSLAPVRDDIELVAADVRDIPPSAFDGVDGVINLSGLSNDPTAEFNPEANWQMNAIATETLGRECVSRGIERYVFASSCSLYDGLPPGMHSENAPVQPRAAYATSKRYGEERLLELADEGFAP